MTPHGLAAALIGLALGILCQPARAFDDAAVAPVTVLDTLEPLAAAALDDQRGRQMPVLLPARQGASGPVRLWDEIARPPRPLTSAAAQGTVTSVSRAAR